MRRIALLVEGQTEEMLVKEVLAPAAAAEDVCLTPVVVITSATPVGAHRGGGHWRHYDTRLRALLRASHWYRVGLLLDYYGYPKGAPGRSVGGHGAERQRELVEAIRCEYADPRLHPLVVLHEIEALVLAAIDAGHGNGLLPGKGLAALRRAVHEAGGPEQVDDGPTTSPSKRLERADPNYMKTVTGPLLIAEARLGAILERCPIFAAWWGELLD
ncbi:DUF4276 family protein [uncultured Propionibacterium sp.]|uniref:DUF4276 family protein n=1 Tax=uncultured Propionibacterium sp. TaxID=218066 RepID=UPI002930B10E|nr:DUF4276 family protein [uncultured Propionibacterium sp.]